MMKQHCQQQGSSFLPHGTKEVSVQYMLVRNVNHRKRSTKHVMDCFHIIINSYLEMSNVVKFQTDLRVVICCDRLSLRNGMAKDDAVDVEEHDEHLFLG